METFVTNNPLFPNNIRLSLEHSPLVVVSGQPSHVFSANGKEFFFHDCQYAIDLPLFVTLAVVKEINPITHPHVPEEFTGEYPAIYGLAPDFDEYIFPVRPEYGFQIRPEIPNQ